MGVTYEKIIDNERVYHERNDSGQSESVSFTLAMIQNKESNHHRTISLKYSSSDYHGDDDYQPQHPEIRNLLSRKKFKITFTIEEVD